jgi:uncharacterized protein
MNNLWLALLTGLTSGGLSCFAVQGGLLTTALTTEDISKVKYQKEKSIFAFLLAKIIAYTLLGFLLGYLGATLTISSKVQSTLQIVIGIYMIMTAGRLLNVHPFFRYFVIQPPKSILRLLRNKSQAKSFFTPMTLGALTVLIPCGVTQAMMLLAIASGSPLWGAGIMFFFILGTSPVFFLIGVAAAELLKSKFFVLAASIFILTMGILSINNAMVLNGSAHTLQNYWAVITNKSFETDTASIDSGTQNVEITVTNSGYESDANTLKVGVPVKLKITTKNVQSCARAFTIPDLNYSKVLPVTGTEYFEFTPTKIGPLVFTCSMGMYSGSFNVIE